MRFLLPLLLIASAFPVAIADAEVNIDAIPWVSDTPLPAAAGEAITFTAEAFTTGLANGATVEVEFFVDDASIGRATATITGWFWMEFASPVWIGTEGDHTVGVIFDPDNAIEEADETDNGASDDFTVYAGLADLRIQDLTFQPEPVRVQDVVIPENPAGRYRIVVEVCNDGTMAPMWGDVSLSVTAQKSNLFDGSERIQAGEIDVSDIAAGACATRDLIWDTDGIVGDIVVEADAYAWPERDYTDNDAEIEAFVLVGGLGGTRLPLP